MDKLLVEIGFYGNNYEAYLPEVDGVVATSQSLDDIKHNIKEAIELHIEGSLEDNDPIPDILKGEYELDFHFSAEALLNYYSNIFTKAALSRITGINERQLWFYAAGKRSPRPEQRKRIEDGLHKLGRELLTISV
ncbi:type II toxin-antitoxin system HicB family antitoxin [Dysgonomonas capnocytophagoides]|uniref:Type II toxin-antitoxin system HicB family antitoxin n=1 Tax=Dysgonomonas capnocytophagoides TaxID=45254 RepID=A0A4Y8KTS2_9BACT|nr:type II toxin-antitoxin system HicB family antitoxin [Dysgonomonas capnocytophagoides]TFD92566.1 type II toxin-antitoxin system HicB family antitoxin [Dysgonomonas capnocytophagoides]